MYCFLCGQSPCLGVTVASEGADMCEHCPVCDAGDNRINLSQGELCSDACALRASDELVHAIEAAVHELAPFINRENFLACMDGIADDLAILPRKLPIRSRAANHNGPSMASLAGVHS